GILPGKHRAVHPHPLGLLKHPKSLRTSKALAERAGFEPALPFRVNTLSKRAPSATRPPLRLLHPHTTTAAGAAVKSAQTLLYCNASPACRLLARMQMPP